MNTCGQCKASFPGWTALRDHFRTSHRREFIAICLWLGPERFDSLSMTSWWYYEAKYTREIGDEDEKVDVGGVVRAVA